MYIIEDILITTDFSDYSSAAVEFAKTFALLYNARIHVLYVAEDSRHLHASDQVMKRGERGISDPEEAMRNFVAQHLPDTREVHAVVRKGKPYEEIVRYAREEGIDLTVIATHGRTGLRHIVIGSVAEKVVRHSSVPVFTVKPKEISDHLITQEDIEMNLHLQSMEYVA